MDFFVRSPAHWNPTNPLRSRTKNVPEMVPTWRAAMYYDIKKPIPDIMEKKKE